MNNFRTISQNLATLPTLYQIQSKHAATEPSTSSVKVLLHNTHSLPGRFMALFPNIIHSKRRRRRRFFLLIRTCIRPRPFTLGHILADFSPIFPTSSLSRRCHGGSLWRLFIEFMMINIFEVMLLLLLTTFRMLPPVSWGTRVGGKPFLFMLQAFIEAINFHKL